MRKKIKVISRKASGLPRPAVKINKSSTYDLCITDKAKETSSCADLFRCGAASVCLDCRMFALCLGVPASLIRLPRCYYYITCKWCMESHLSSDAGVLLALVPWLPCAVRAARVAAGCVREPGLAVCPASWPACVPVAWCCGAVLCPAPWCVGLLCLPCGLGLYVGLVHGPLISPCHMGLFCGLVFRALYGPLKKGFFSPGFFRLCISGIFPGFIFALKFPARFSGLQRLDFFSGFFRVDFSGENFAEIFPGFIFRHFFWPDFRDGIWLLLFSRCNIRMIPGSP